MRKAIEAQLTAEQQQLRQLQQMTSGISSGGLGSGRPTAAPSPVPSLVPDVRLVEFKKASCREAKEQPGHVCDFSMTLEANGTRNQANASGRFFKAASGQLAVELARR